ncbi:dolichyl-P-Man:Man(7)GlcNAc(2)-PP-dolichol alpha-1,6-mannosyltransferase [Pleurotus ostreatus]|uniref:Mannosyltransferase n=1 Tax=Pleurotus ostreatus TaxID=5322 RepID=A0A8H7A2G0_PLEOS|nr:dolichyl-P-Man:Man(7)GlcNAc(2)-PP-dolichol alpha-1,6-mannosyltransferase [Pleurotus ostreatus]KAF7432767.1 dolichyl-P-Man:Man(7)GlcNAc(2)-PP-dolichol alpha-1,6-mannosyltransferase [Pleurotus ostreatus]
MLPVLQDVLILASAWFHVILAPYTKVEESFNLHATHDVLMYGTNPLSDFASENLYKYDHFIFPGAVPRTFLGSLALAYLAAPFLHIANAFNFAQSKVDLQIIVRLVLATLNALGLILIRRAVSGRFGRSVASFYTLLTISQFHLPFWMGRTLPNMFALFPVNVSTSILISPSANPYAQRRAGLKAICIIIFTAVVFRAELALLLVPIIIQHLYRSVFRSYTFLSTVRQLLVVGATTGVISITLTTAVDSYFWDRFNSPLWPEFSSVWFNIVEGKSVEWGVSPYRTYLVSSLPKLLLTAYPLAMITLMAPVRRSKIRSAVFPYLTFVLLISCLAHKEWRFIIYVVPVFNVAAARALAWANNFGSGKGESQRRGFVSKLLSLPLRLLPFGCLAINIAVTVLLVLSSRRNYPGGEAMHVFHSLLPSGSQENVHVHICNLAAQTGASLFTQTQSPPNLITHPNNDTSVVYSKTESLSPSQLTSGAPPYDFTHLIIENHPTLFLGALSRTERDKWEVIATLYGFERWIIANGSLHDGSRREKTRRMFAEGAKNLSTNPWNAETWAWLASLVIKMEETEKLWILKRTTGIA